MSERTTASGPAGALLAQVERELEVAEREIRSHRFIELIGRGEVPKERLSALAGEQFTIIRSDRRSFAYLASRYPEAPAGAFFLGMAEGEGEALRRLLDLAAWAGLDEEGLRAYEPAPGAQAYPAFVAWLALNGSRGDVALAFLANLAAWGESCGRVAEALRSRYGAGDAEVAFFDFFASPPPDFEERALAVLEAGLAAGESPDRARRATRLLQAYELSFWDAMAQGL